LVLEICNFILSEFISNLLCNVETFSYLSLTAMGIVPPLLIYPLPRPVNIRRARDMQPALSLVITWILHESEAFICKALKGKAIVAYA
jgi:hypothetical protein